jgi:iron(III) transport system ATP-binding protein
MSELAVRGLEKAFGATPVLRGVDLAVPQGSLTAVLGPSGCGKTTLLRVIAGFEPADAGTVTLDGRVVSRPGAGVPPEQRRIGFVPQEGALFPHLSVASNVAFGLSRAQRRSGRAEEMLGLVGLAGYGARMPGELSGGQQQRVALARALAPEPALVLLDEPFTALDTGLRSALREDVRSALRAAGATAVLVTHDQQEALSMADLVAVMRDGRVVQCAPPSALYTAPADVGVATFVGEAVVLPARMRDGFADTPLGRLPVRTSCAARAGAATQMAAPEAPVGTEGQVVLRPEQIAILRCGEGLPARVTGTAFFGHDALVQLTVADSSGAAVQVSSRTHGPLAVRDDQEVGLAVDGDVAFYPSPA